MRMDNETYRLKVESLFRDLPAEDAEWNPQVLGELEQLALVPKKTRYFLKALNEQPVPVQLHFYTYVLAQANNKDVYADLERHIRHRFYEAREEIKEILASLRNPAVLPALFQIIALTDEGWLAGELIRLVLAFEPELLRQPVGEALNSGDYLLQCLAIYLTGKSKADPLVDVLAQFYKKPFGEKVDRLERKAYDALMEGIEGCSDGQILRWLQDGNARVRDLGITAAARRRLKAAVGAIVRLVLVDAKTRARAAGTLLDFEAEQLLEFDAVNEASQAITEILQAAKRGPLVGLMKELMRDEAPAVRELAVKLVRLMPRPDELMPGVGRLATEERSRSVQLAALTTLARLDRSRFMTAVVEIFTEAGGAGPQGELSEAIEELMDAYLSAAERDAVQAEIDARREKRDAALDKFAGAVEWWRHDL